MRAAAARIANAIRAIKRDESGPKLQKEFFENAAKPTATKQESAAPMSSNGRWRWSSSPTALS
jgi:hypothetical protein